MPLSATVHDLPHCGRGQKGIDFFFKTPPVLTSPVAQEKRDILAYFKRIEIAKDQEDQSQKSSLSNDENDTDSSLFSSEEDVKPGKNEKISAKEKDGNSSKNCNKSTSKGERSEPANGTKEAVMASIDLTDETEHSDDSLIIGRGQSGKVCNASSRLSRNPRNTSKSESSEDGQTSPAVTVDLSSECEEGTTNGPRGCRLGDSETEINGAIKGKGQVNNPSTSSNSASNKKNAFTFMMANRARQTEGGKHSAEEVVSSDCNSQKSDDDCMIVVNSPSQEGDVTAKSAGSVKCNGSHKSQKAKNDKEKEEESKPDLDSSLQDFDLTPFEKPKRKRIRKPKAMKEKKTNTKSCLEEAAPPPNDPPSNIPEKVSRYISFTDYMKGECSVAKDSVVEESSLKEASEVTESGESTSKCKINEARQQQAPNHNPDCPEDNLKCPKDDLKDEMSSSLQCNEVVKKRLSCSSEKLGEEQEVQMEHKDTKAMPQSKQPAARMKRKRSRKRIFLSSDSEDDVTMSKSAGTSKKKETKSCAKPQVVSNTARISNFFKTINQKDVDEENKVVFTVQADVHAPLDGNEKTERKHGSPVHTQPRGELVGGSSITKDSSPNTGSIRRNTRKCKGVHNNANLDELNKIELLEQIVPSKSSKKVLNKVCVEGKDSEKEKKSDNTNREISNTVKAKSKVTLASRKGKLTEKESLSAKRENVKDTAGGVGRKLLRRRKFQMASSEESQDEQVCPEKKNEPPQNDKDVTVTSASSSSSSSSISSVNSSIGPEDMEVKSTSTVQSSPEASEDDKENVAHYTSQLVTRPGKLRLRIRRVHVPQEACRKKLKQTKANRNAERLKKTKGTRSNTKKRRLRVTLKQKSPKEGVKKDVVGAEGTPVVKHDLVTLSDDADDTTKKQVPKKTTRKGRITQTLLKPLLPKPAPKRRLRRKGLVVNKEGHRKAESGQQDGTQRRTPRRAATNAKKYTEEVVTDDDDNQPKKTEKNPKKLVQDKGVKLAPIFCKRAASPCVELLKVVPLSPSKLKARQEFLNSSVSDDVRKQLAVEKSGEDEVPAWPPFPTVSHVQQRKEEEAALWNLKEPQLPLKKEPSYSPSKSLVFTQDQNVLDKRDAPQTKQSCHVPRLELGDIVFSLSCMKSKYPDFPVYEVFKAYYELKKEAVEAYRKEVQKEQTVVYLDDDDEEEGSAAKRRKRKRKGKLSTLGRGKRRKLGTDKEAMEEMSQNQKEEVQGVWHERTPHTWTQMFLPRNAKQVIGNAENVKKLKLWLQEWKNKPQIKPRKKRKKAKKDDFITSDESTLDGEEEEYVSTYLLTGPPGAGKTAAVYALASELGYKVLEVNASSRRPGRQVMSQLAEATQSHSVSNTSASSHSSSAFASLFASRMSSNVTKKESSQTGDASSQDKDSSKMKGVSLVLFEDIDIVFEEWDEGFMSTVNSLMATTKRPIILTATHASPAILSQIKESFEIMEFIRPPQRLTAQHLQLIALASGCHVCLQDVECLVSLNKGDVRKSMLDLQLLSQSGSSHDTCGCAVSENTLDSDTEDNWKEVFPEAGSIIHKKSNQIKFYKVGLWQRLSAKTDSNTTIPNSCPDHLYDQEGIDWKKIEGNINYILPFPANEKEKSLPRYPLQADDPLLKKSSWWQYESLMTVDDEEVKKDEPATEDPKRRVKHNDPPEVQKASQNCLESLASMYDLLAQLDVLNSSQITTHTVEIKDFGWWVKQPTTGLSDGPSPSHPHGTPHSNEGIIQELAEKAVTCCAGQIASALEGVTGKDWPQLSLPGDTGGETQSCVVHSSNCEREQGKKRSVMRRVCEHLPAVSQVSRSAGLDYLSALRSLAREDELGSALGRGRRGRRFLSYFPQLGWIVSPEDRISLANSLIT